MDTIITNCLPFLQSLPAELLSFTMLVVCVLFLLLNFHFFGKAGIISFIVMVITIANIQVLKPVYYQLLQEPLALGTVCFTTTLLASDILNEHYGPETAKLSVLIGFISQLFFTIILSLTLGFKPAADLSAHNAMLVIFTPSLRLLISSLTAYTLSQLVNIWLYHWLSKLTHKRLLWLRTNLSNITAGLLDSILFSCLAWIILAPEPVSLHTLFWTYILGGFIARIIVSILTTPVLYLTYKLKK